MRLMLSCRQVTELAGDHAERRLRLPERLALRMHIALCAGCRAFVEQIRLTMRGLRALPAPAGPPPSEELIGRFRNLVGRRVP